jgi:hypothetical protein
MLFNTEKRVNLEKLRKGSFCITYSLSGWPSWHRADIEGIIGEKANFECKISVFRLFCPQLWLEPSLDIRDQKVQIKVSQEAIPFQVAFLLLINVNGLELGKAAKSRFYGKKIYGMSKPAVRLRPMAFVYHRNGALQATSS